MRPSLKRTMLARTPLIVTSFTTSCLDSSGISASDTRELSTAANSLSLLNSDSEALPRSAPRLGQNASLMSPSSLSVRCFFSFTSWMICGL